VHDHPATTLATIGRRIAARLIDGVVVAVATLVPMIAFSHVRIGDGIAEMPGWMVWSTWLVSLVYEVVATALAGQTIGKRLVGIRVADATTGAVPTLEQSMRRAAPVLLQQAPWVGWLAGVLYLPALWRPRRQGFHDVLASTVVVTVGVRAATRSSSPRPS
jgi:uncharacterized RDD family membrane protein YckC